jgi:hypothetical protein
MARKDVRSDFGADADSSIAESEDHVRPWHNVEMIACIEGIDFNCNPGHATLPGLFASTVFSTLNKGLYLSSTAILIGGGKLGNRKGIDGETWRRMNRPASGPLSCELRQRFRHTNLKTRPLYTINIST